MTSISSRSNLICLLETKKQRLMSGLDALVQFEKKHDVSLRLVGSVPECAYWLDSDIDVYLDRNMLVKEPDAWIELDECDSFDVIVQPDIGFKQRILSEGVSPTEAKARLAAFNGEIRLVEGFAKRRYNKILQTLDNSRYFLKQLARLQAFYTRHTTTPFQSGQVDSFLQALAYDVRIGKVAFRFVWVGLMVLSGYEHLEQPKSREMEYRFGIEDLKKWHQQLGEPIENRAPFDISGAELVLDFYQRVERGVLSNPFSLPADLDPIKRVDEWQQAFEAFDHYTRQWLEHHWKPQL